MKINVYVKNRGPSVYLKFKAQYPSFLRRKRSSQPSSELSSSDKRLAAEKGERKLKKMGELEAAGKLLPALCITELK